MCTLTGIEHCGARTRRSLGARRASSTILGFSSAMLSICLINMIIELLRCFMAFFNIVIKYLATASSPCQYIVFDCVDATSSFTILRIVA